MKQFAFAALDAEAAGGDSMADNRQCDWADCACEGAHPAPRSRESLRDRYWFCKEHAREYNRAWPFSRGDHLGGAMREQAQAGRASQRKTGRTPVSAAERRAASTLGLSIPYTKASLKTCYRSRAKAAHPDLNPDDPRAEDRFKELREAYMTLLRSIST